MAAGGHHVPDNSADSLWEHPVDSSGVRPPLITLHVKLLSRLPVSFGFDGSSGGDATCHAERALWHLGALSRVLPCLALLRCHVL